MILKFTQLIDSLMKSLGYMVLLGAFGTAAVQGQTSPPPMRDAATHEQLAERARKAAQAVPVKPPVAAPAKPAAPSKVEPPRSLLAESDIVCYNGNATLVPKRAILQMPKNLADRLKYQPGAKLLNWHDFYALNRGWITTVEVSRVQAEGNSPLAEETQKKIVKSGNLVVATYQAGPISVLPLKVPAETSPKTPKP